MSRSRRRKKNLGGSAVPVELNVMPFIDVFSLLTTFLLFSAVFITIGVIEVQLPFFSSKVSPSDDKEERTFEIKVDATEEKLVISTNFTMEPKEEKSYDFDNTEDGLKEFHTKLYEFRAANPKVDKLTLFSSDEIIYEKLVNILDAIKYLHEEEVEIVKPGAEPKTAIEESNSRPKNLPLYPKVVMGDVIMGKE